MRVLSKIRLQTDLGLLSPQNEFMVTKGSIRVKFYWENFLSSLANLSKEVRWVRWINLFPNDKL